jgi:signal peptidase II
MLVVAALVIALDQTTKWLVSTRMELYQSWAPVPSLADWFTITYTTNTGAAFGLFKDWALVFAVVAIIVIVVIFYYQQFLEEGQWLLRVALGFQLGGATGNLIDRLRLGGHVVDFLDLRRVPILNIHWPVSNFADISIVIGVALLILVMLREPQSDGQKTPAPPEEPPNQIDSPAQP